MRNLIVVLWSVLWSSLTYAQLPPFNSYLPDSPFPTIHGGNYRQASTPLPGPTSDKLTIDYTDCPDRHTTAWLFYSDKYPNGERVIWAKSNTHVFKLRSTPTGIAVIASYQYSKKRLGLNLNFLLFKNHEVWLRQDDGFLVLSEQDTSNLASPIVALRHIKLTGAAVEPAHLGVLYDGNIAFNTKGNQVAVMNRQGQVLDVLTFEMKRRDVSFHNEIAIDDQNNVYMVTNESMFSFHWDGHKISLNWRSDYDFGGNRLQGSGTTPTLMGVGNMDKLVLVCDSRTPTNLIAFWCNRPANWKGLPGYDRQIAGVAALPGASPSRLIYTAIENSPVCWGYGIAAAQYNGFFGQSCTTQKGVYKCEWDPASRKLVLKWHRDDINFNGVMTYSASTNLTYGSGRENDCYYYYYGLDWTTGRTVWRLKLGNAKQFDDPGCANVIGEDRSILFPTRTGVVRLLP